jgi:alkylated DNA repair dioxygenase AlkB
MNEITTVPPDYGGLFDIAPPRRELGAEAWLELHTGWLPDPDPLLAALLTEVPWQAERRRMYERTVAVPRLTCFYPDGAALPHPALEAARLRLSRQYQADLRGEPLTSVGLCLYRNGEDSVAWHGDTVGRGATDDTVVAIVSLGETRPFLVRPRGGGPAVRYHPGHGDLLTMGGSCQRTHDHAVPKVPAAGARVSVQFRATGVR